MRPEKRLGTLLLMYAEMWRIQNPVHFCGQTLHEKTLVIYGPRVVFIAVVRVKWHLTESYRDR